jgi:hypothetical protein
VLGARDPELDDLAILELGQAEATSAGEEQVEHRPAQAQAARLAGEAPDDLGAPPHLLERALQQVRGAEAAAQARQVLEVDAQRRQILGQAGRRVALQSAVKGW